MLKTYRSIQHQCLHRPRPCQSRCRRSPRSERPSHRESCTSPSNPLGRTSLTESRSTLPSLSALRSSSQRAFTTQSASLVSPPLTLSAPPALSPNSKAPIPPMRTLPLSGVTLALQLSLSFPRRATRSKAKSWMTSSIEYNSEVTRS